MTPGIGTRNVVIWPECPVSPDALMGVMLNDSSKGLYVLSADYRLKVIRLVFGFTEKPRELLLGRNIDFC